MAKLTAAFAQPRKEAGWHKEAGRRKDEDSLLFHRSEDGDREWVLILDVEGNEKRINLSPTPM